MRRRQIIISLLVVASIFFSSQMILAQSLTIWVENYPPFGFEKNEKIMGLSTEVAQYITEDAGIKVNSWTIAPWARAFSETKNHPNTMLYTVVRQPDREELFHWIGPISDRNIYLFKLKSRTDISVHSLEDAKKYIIGTVNSTASTDYLESMGFKTEKVSNYEQNMLKLLYSRVDLIDFLAYSLAFLSKNVGVDYSLFEKTVLVDGSKKYYIVLNKNTDPSIVNGLQKSFEKMVQSGELKKMQSKYLP